MSDTTILQGSTRLDYILPYLAHWLLSLCFSENIVHQVTALHGSNVVHSNNDKSNYVWLIRNQLPFLKQQVSLITLDSTTLEIINSHWMTNFIPLLGHLREPHITDTTVLQGLFTFHLTWPIGCFHYALERIWVCRKDKGIFAHIIKGIKIQ